MNIVADVIFGILNAIVTNDSLVRIAFKIPKIRATSYMFRLNMLLCSITLIIND